MSSLLRQCLLILGLALLPAAGQALYLREKVSWQSPIPASEMVTVADAREWGSNAIWLDARSVEDFEKEHVPGALNLNGEHWGEQLPQMLATWSPEKRLIVYCSSVSCGSSREIARRLRQEAELKNVFVLEGGWEAWVAAKK